MFPFLRKRTSAREVKSVGFRTNPLTQYFFGQNFTDLPELNNSDEGLTRAFYASMWASRCIKTIGMRAASIPLIVKTLDDKYVDRYGKPLDEPPISRVNYHPLQWLVGEEMKPQRRRFFYDTQIWGRGFFEPTNLGLLRLNPKTIEIEKDHTGVVSFRQILDGSQTKEWRPSELIYLYDYDPDDDLGSVPPLAWALQAVQTEINMGQYVSAFFENDATPPGLLTSDQQLSDAEMDRIEAWWTRLFRGAENKHKTGVAGSGLKYEKIGSDIANLAIPDLRLEVRREICATFGVPTTIAGADEAANYATMNEQHVSFYEETILPIVDMLVASLNQQLLRMPAFREEGRHLKIVADISGVSVLQEDKAEVTTRTTAGYSQGVYSLNEAREKEGLPQLAEDYINVPNVGLVRVSDLPKIADRAVAPPEQGGYTAGTGTDTSAAEAPEAGMAAETPFADTSTEADATDEAAPGGDKSAWLTSERQSQIRTALEDLARWEKKALNRGHDKPFQSIVVPRAVKTFLRWDLEASGGERDAVKSAFAHAKAAMQSKDPTPQEFEEYWDGIDDVTESFAQSLEEAFRGKDLRKRLAERLDNIQDPQQASLVIQEFFQQLENEFVDDLAGTEEEPGALAQLWLAGAARGQQLHDKVVDLSKRQAKSAGFNKPRRATKQLNVSTAWNMLHKDALNFARSYAFGLIKGINQSTVSAFQDSMSDWINKGGTLPNLIDYFMGRMKGLDIPEGWSDKKIEWATSRQRARMIAQTESTRAFTEGNVGRWKQLGVKQIKFKTQADRVVCPLCRSLNGEITNIGTPFKVRPEFISSAHNAKRSIDKPPVHVGCILPGNEVIVPGGAVAGAKSFYVGRAVEIKLANGSHLTATQNHPVLTRNGWVSAGELRKGMQVASAVNVQRMAQSINPHNNNVPTEIEKVFSSLEMSGTMLSSRVPVSPEDLHADGRFIKGDVKVVYPSGSLLGNGMTHISQPSSESEFEDRSSGECCLSCGGLLDPLINRTLPSDGSGMSFIEHGAALFRRCALPSKKHRVRRVTLENARVPQDRVHSHSAYPDILRDRIHRLSPIKTMNDVTVIDVDRTSAVTNRNADTFKAGDQGRAGNTDLSGEFTSRFAEFIAFSDVVDIRSFKYSGHVYDLQAGMYELYICNGIVVKNCRCFVSVIASSRVRPLERVEPKVSRRKPQEGEIVVGTKPTGVKR